MAGKKGDTKKGGKGKEDKKGKDAKKGKSESEETSEADLTKSNVEEGEMDSEMVVEEEEEEEETDEDPKNKKGKKGAAKGAKKPAKGKKGATEGEDEEDASGKKKRQLKGASKLVMGLATDDAKKKKGAKKEHAKAQLKGATKAMAMAKKETAAAAPPTKKRSLKSTSKLFMGFKGKGQKSTKTGQFKNTSRFLWGLKKDSTKKKQKQKKNKAVLKSTSNLMMRFKALGSKKKVEATKKEAADSSKSSQKPAFMLIRLGPGGGKAGDSKAKGGGFFSGLFKRRKTGETFKPRAQILSKAAAATSWLTRTFLAKRGRYIYDERLSNEAWLSRIGAKKLPFPPEDEILRHRANMRRFPGSNMMHDGQTQEDYGYWENMDSVSPLDYYDNYQEEGYDDLGTSSQYGYYDDDAYGRYPVDEGYGPYEEPVEYFDHLPQDQYGYPNDEIRDDEISAGYSPYEPYDDYRNGYQEPTGPNGQYAATGNLHYVGEEEMEDPGNGYHPHEVSDSEPEWPTRKQSSYNPYAYPLDNIMETEEVGGSDEEEGGYPFPESHSSSFFERHGVEENLLPQISLNRKFRLFPRPQVKLFGKDKLDVSLPPSPHISLASLDQDEDEDEDSESWMSPLAQFDDQHLEPPKASGTFSKLIHGCFSSRFQGPVPPNPGGRNLSTGGHQETNKPRFSPRECGSPLGQFLQRSLMQPKPILKHHGSWGEGRPPTPSPTRRGFPSPFGKSGSMRDPPPAQQGRRHFGMPTSASSPKSIRHFGNEGRDIPQPSFRRPSSRLHDALQEELHNTLPFIKSSSSAPTPHQGLGPTARKFSQAAPNHNSSQRLISPQRSHWNNSSALKQSTRSSVSNRPQRAFDMPASNHPVQEWPDDHVPSQGSSLWPITRPPNPSLRMNPLTAGCPPAKGNSPSLVPSWGQRSANIGRPLGDCSPQTSSSSPSLRPTARNYFVSQQSPSSKGSVRTEASFRSPSPPFSLNSYSSKVQDCARNMNPGRLAMTGYHNPISRGLKASSPSQTSLRQFGSPPIANAPQPSSRMSPLSLEAQGRLPQAWNRQPEPPTKAVKPLMRNQFMRQFGHESPMLSARSSRTSSPHMATRQGSRRVTIRENTIESVHGRSFDDASEAEATQWLLPQQRSTRASRTGMPAPLNPSSKMGASGSLRSVSSLPPRSAPSTPKSFIKRIGQPLAGMAPAASCIRPPPSETTGHTQEGNPYQAQFHQDPRRSPSHGRHPFSQHYPPMQSLGPMGEPDETRSPKLGRGNSSHPIARRNFGTLRGRADLNPMSPRPASFRGPQTMRRASPSPPQASSVPNQYNRPRRRGPAHLPAGLLENEVEDGMGRYAVVTPQVHRMGSSFRRASRRQNQQWTGYHTVNVHEMPNEKLFHHRPEGSFKRRASRRRGSIAWYLTRGTPVCGGMNKSWQCKVMERALLNFMQGSGHQLGWGVG